jgi:hypothetical protein
MNDSAGIRTTEAHPGNRTLDALTDKAAERVEYYRLRGYHCSESSIRAVADVMNLELSHDIQRISSGFRGGGGGYMERCGVLESGIILISYLYGRTRAHESIYGYSYLIRKLHDYPLKLAVASSSPLSDILETLEAFQIRSCFQALVSATTCARSKPFPDVFLKAAEQLSVSPAACLVIEDSRNGLLAAKAAGMACLAYANPHYARQDLKEADRVIDDFAALAVEDLKNLVQPA